MNSNHQAKILGVSHIIHSGFDSKVLPKIYEFVFEESPPWPEEKRSFVRKVPEQHKIAFWRSPNDVSIERVMHNTAGNMAGSTTSNTTTGDTEGPYRLILKNVKAPGGTRDVTSECVSEAFQTQAVASTNSAAHFAFVGMEIQSTDLGAVALHTSDVEKTSEFWQKHLGFVSIKKSTGRWDLMGLQARFSKVNVQVLLVKAPTTRYFLDDLGWTGLSLQVTSVEVCRQQMLADGIEVSSAFPLNVGGRSFRLVFLRAPTGEIIELCEATSS